ncbi:DNA-binding response regulator [Marinilabiliaceae bacterium JC017]|nr:DNA-binding response regulator [Marinilabiliaceae bacterium JC017]
MKIENVFSVWLVDDHTLFRSGLKTLLKCLPDISVEKEAGNGAEFLELLLDGCPDLVLLDIAMPGMGGVEAAQKALSLFPDLKIIVLSMYGEQEYYTRLVEIGVKGFMLKNSDFCEVKNAINLVLKGGSYFSQELMQQMILAMRQPGVRGADYSVLSDREKQVVVQVCKGFSNQEIAENLHISKRTVEKHRANVLLKTECNNTAALVIYAIKNQLVEV